jgi:hypothetical protein
VISIVSYLFLQQELEEINLIFPLRNERSLARGSHCYVLEQETPIELAHLTTKNCTSDRSTKNVGNTADSGRTYLRVTYACRAIKPCWPQGDVVVSEDW